MVNETNACSHGGSRVARIKVERLTPEAFAPFGEVIQKPSGKSTVAMEGVLDYWDQVCLLDLGGGTPQLGFLATYARAFRFDALERHVRSDEVFIPLEGVSIFALCPAANPDDPREVPDLARARAFVLDGSAGVNLSRGVWHAAPMPLTPKATFALVMRKGTVEEDIDIRDLRSAVGATCEVEI